MSCNFKLIFKPPTVMKQEYSFDYLNKTFYTVHEHADVCPVFVWFPFFFESLLS